MNALPIPAASISPLRQRLIDDLTMRRFTAETQRNYQVGDVRLWRIDERLNHLLVPERPGLDRDQHHDLDTEARIDGLDPVAEEAGEAFAIAHRLGGANSEAPPRTRTDY